MAEAFGIPMPPCSPAINIALCPLSRYHFCFLLVGSLAAALSLSFSPRGCPALWPLCFLAGVCLLHGRETGEIEPKHLTARSMHEGCMKVVSHLEQLSVETRRAALDVWGLTDS